MAERAPGRGGVRRALRLRRQREVRGHPLLPGVLASSARLASSATCGNVLAAPGAWAGRGRRAPTSVPCADPCQVPPGPQSRASATPTPRTAQLCPSATECPARGHSPLPRLRPAGEEERVSDSHASRSPAVLSVRDAGSSLRLGLLEFGDTAGTGRATVALPGPLE